MELKKYFAEHKGTGILSTADSAGRVDSAIYARPHAMEDGKIALIMLDRLSHKNLQENPYAVYLFIEQAAGYQGVRLFLKKTSEDNDPKLIAQMTRRCLYAEDDAAKRTKFIVYFEIEKQLPLVGSAT